MLESGVMAHNFTLLPDMKEILRCESRFDLLPVLGLRWGTLIRAIVDVLVNDQCQQSALYGVCSVLLSGLSNDERWMGSLRPSDVSWNWQNVISNFIKLISECKALTGTLLPHEGFCGYYQWNLVFEVMHGQMFSGLKDSILSFSDSYLMEKVFKGPLG